MAGSTCNSGFQRQSTKTSMPARIVAKISNMTPKTSEMLGISFSLSPHTVLNAAFTILVLIAFVIWRYKRRSLLKTELRQAKEKLKYLQEKLERMDVQSRASRQDDGKKEVRIFMDGAFDLMHYGHMNAFRLGRSLGTQLVVGVNSDRSITECKGAPLMNDQERLTMVSACKFVDEIVPGCPYIMNHEYLGYVIQKYRIDYVVHGDDPCIVDGKDVYASAKAAGKYRSIPRTEGVSTTDIIGRMLIMTKEHHIVDTTSTSGTSSSCHPQSDGRLSKQEDFLLSQQSKFLTTSRMLQLFSSGVRAPTPGSKVVYIDGSWDMFHPGHVSLLKMAKERGDFLIVGVHGDSVVNKVLGMNLPLMNLHERVLSVLGCRYVDDVLIDAPYVITEDMVASLKISEILETPGTGYDWAEEQDDNNSSSRSGNEDRFRFVKKEIRHRITKQPCQFSLQNVFARIKHNQNQFQARFERKMDAERKFYDQKHSSENGSLHN